MSALSLLNAVAVAVAVFSMLHNLWALGNVVWAVRWVERSREVELPALPLTSVILLLPMYEEQSVAEAAIEYFLRLDYPTNLYHIVVVTTSRESAETGLAATADVVDEYLRKHPTARSRITHCRANGTDRCKADQLNQAIAQLDQQKPGWWAPEIVLGVFDADSRPELQVLRDLDRAARREPGAQAFQQPAVYFAGFDDLPRGVRGAYIRSRPLYNLRFCLYRELPGFLRSVSASRSCSSLVHTLLASPNHFLGHGEFVRLQMLRSVGGFPPPSADTSLGTVLSYLGYAIVPLSTFDVGQTPASISGLIQQGANWYAGCILYFRNLRLALKLGASLSLVHLLMAIKRWQENMIWCAGPILFALSVVWGLVRGEGTVLWPAIWGSGLHLLTILIVFRAYLRWSPRFEPLTPLPRPSAPECGGMVLMYPVMLTGTCLGPLLYYSWVFRKAVTGRPLPRPKTQRVADGREPEGH